MKFLLIYGLSFLILWQTCRIKNASVSNSKNTFEIKNDTISFAKDVQPVLVRHCSPCHFMGGKMYERLPFDKDATIINHQAGILRRIKNEEDNAIIKNFISQNKNGSSSDKPSNN